MNWALGGPKEARMAARVGMCMVFTESISVTTIMILGRKILGYSFSKEERVVDYVGDLMVLVAVLHLGDGLQCVISGVARGCGWQKICVFINLGTFFVIGIPVGILLAFVFHLGGKGLWTGLIVAVYLQSLLLFILTICTNWKKEAEKASARLHDSAHIEG